MEGFDKNIFEVNSDELRNIGPTTHNHKAKDLFLVEKLGIINFLYFKKYFEQVSIPLELAKDCLNSLYHDGIGKNVEVFIKFINFQLFEDMEDCLFMMK
jgi:hypothetical protein